MTWGEFKALIDNLLLENTLVDEVDTAVVSRIDVDRPGTEDCLGLEVYVGTDGDGRVVITVEN
jgi:hypothetical protein